MRDARAVLAGASPLSAWLLLAGCLVVTPLVFIPQAFDPFVSPRWFVIKLTALVLVVQGLASRNWWSRRLFETPLDVCACLLLLASVVGSFGTPGRWGALQRPSQIVAGWMLYRVAVQRARRRGIQGIAAVALVPGLLLSVAALVFWPKSIGRYYEPFEVALIGHGNYAGQWAILLVPVAVGLFLYRGGRLLSWFGFLSSALLSFYLLVSRCRAAWLALAVSAALVLLAGGGFRALKASSRLRQGVVALLLVGSVLLLWRYGALGERVRSAVRLSDTGSRFRILTWESTLRMIRENVWGIGTGRFVAYYPRYRSQAERSLFRERTFVKSPHNDFLLAAVETGPVGLLAMLFLACTVAKLCLRQRRLSDRKDFVLAMGISVGVMATMLHSLFSFNLESPVCSLVFWVFAGTIAGRLHPDTREAGQRRAWPKLAVGSALALTLAAALWADARYVTASVYAGSAYEQKRKRDLDRAAAGLRRAVKLWPESPRYLHLLAKVASERGDFASVERYEREALRFWPYFRDGLLYLGVSLHRQGRFDEAEDFIKAALAVQPDFAKARIALGNLYSAQRRFDQALDQYLLAGQRQPFGEDAYLYVAAVKLRLGRLDEALAAVRKALVNSHRFLDERLSIELGLRSAINTVGTGRFSFKVVARDSQMWTVWESPEYGLVQIDASENRFLVISQCQGARLSVLPSKGLLKIRFLPVPSAYVYSLVAPQHNQQRSFDFIANPKFHSRIFTLYARILHRLGRDEEARSAFDKALRFDSRNRQARQGLAALQRKP